MWDRLQHEMLNRLQDADQIDWSRAAMDASLVPAKKAGRTTGRNSTDRAKPGTKRHLVTDRQSIPLAELTTVGGLLPAPWA